MSNHKKDPFLVRLGQALTMRSFDLDDDPYGYPDLNWVIARFMLADIEGRDEYGIGQGLWQGAYPKRVKESIPHAIAYVQEKLKKPVYRIRLEGQRPTRVITVDAEYRNAKEEEYNRIRRGVEQKVAAAFRQLSKVAPDKVAKLTGHVRKALPEE